MSCRRGIKKKLPVFVHRFYGIESEQLTHANETSDSPVGEVMAINLLSNANLPESTLTNAKIELIKQDEKGVAKKESEESKLSVAKGNAEDLNRIFDHTQSITEKIETPDGGDDKSADNSESESNDEADDTEDEGKDNEESVKKGNPDEISKFRMAYFQSMKKRRVHLRRMKPIIKRFKSKKNKSTEENIIFDIKCTRMTCTISLDDAVSYLYKLKVT